MKKLSFILALSVTICALSVLGVFASASSAKLDGEIDKKVTSLYNGVTKTYYSLSADSEFGLQKFWTVEFDPMQSDLYFDVVGGGDYATTLKTVSSTVNAFAKNNADKTPIAAVNGDLWMVTYAHARVEGKGTVYKNCSDPVVKKSMTLPRGFNMYGGEIITSSHIPLETPYEGDFYSFGVTDDGTAVLGNPKVTVKVSDKTQNTSFNADGINRLPANNAIIMYTDRGAASSCALDEAWEIVVDCGNDYTVRHGSVISGKVTAITKAGETKLAMKKNRLIFTVRGTKLSKIDSVKVGDSIEVSVSVSDKMGNDEIWQNMSNCVGGHIPVIVNGVKKNVSDKTAYPMSVLGIKGDGKVVMLTNDGRQSGYSTGIKISKLQDLCEDLGIVTAFILDGGGSAAMVTLEDGKYKLQNRPSDGSERSVVNTVILSYGPDRGGSADSDDTVIDFGAEDILDSVSNLRNLSAEVAEGGLKLTLTETRTPKFTYSFDGRINASNFKYAAITLKCDSKKPENNVLGMYFFSGANSSATSANRYGLNIQNTSKWHTYVLDLSKLTVWSGRFSGIRFDLFDYTYVGEIGDVLCLKELRFFENEPDAAAYSDEQNKLSETADQEVPTGATETQDTGYSTVADTQAQGPSGGCKSTVGMACIIPMIAISVLFTKKKRG